MPVLILNLNSHDLDLPSLESEKKGRFSAPDIWDY